MTVHAELYKEAIACKNWPNAVANLAQPKENPLISGHLMPNLLPLLKPVHTN
jgi:hypothetical protein